MECLLEQHGDIELQIEPTKIKFKPRFLFFSKLSQVYSLQSHPSSGWIPLAIRFPFLSSKHPSISLVDSQIHLKLDERHEGDDKML
ncbi:hypothetical protein OIU79_005237 [Salix purpurea]|uniref:Uncharacterized protein n=1 Tax=Salix purpurea TaxID=77065 RepID=A0A9Q0UCA5_SALPP|nr:hypothetical protein OIU79_005237 [Salix purpurea]